MGLENGVSEVVPGCLVLNKLARIIFLSSSDLSFLPPSIAFQISHHYILAG